MELPRRVPFGRRQLLLVLVALVAIYAIVPQVGSFRRSLPLLRHADPAYLLLALTCVLLTYVAAAGTYCCLAFRPLRYARTVLVQIAGAFVNRLLPAGIGGMSINFAYLRRSRHSKAAAVSVVALNNTLGFIGHGMLLGVLLLIYHQDLPGLQLWRARNPLLLLTVTPVVLLVWFLIYRRYRSSIHGALREFVRQLMKYRQRPLHLAGALACSMALTLCNALGLWLCVYATGGSTPFIAVFLAFSFGVALGAATPTPGGLGGVETGLVAGLAIYHTDSPTVLAAVLVYRLLSYWLPMLAGLVAFLYSQKRAYI